MRCKSCDYPLWNLSARACPECGAPFRPSDFEFTSNSVRFCCPHCAQAYYGTGANGHLVPAAFQCVSCGRPVTMDECVLLPTEGVHEDLTKADQNPWLERRKLGTFKAWFATVGRAMTQPGRLIEATPETAPWGLVYATVTNLIFSIVGVLGIVFIAVAAAAGFGGGSGAGRLAGVAGGLGITLASVVAGIVLGLMLWILTTHAVLRISGGSAYPIRRTAQAICFSAGANALSAIPILGAYLSWLFVIWWIVAATVMVARGQRVHGGRAAAAVLTFPVLLIVGTAGLIGLTIYYATPSFPPPNVSAPIPAPPPPAAPSRVEGVAGALAGYRAEHGGAWPFHAILLVPDHLAPADLALTGGPPSLYDIPLEQYVLYGKDTADKFHEFIRKQMPPGVVAHRIGDFVFTYHGLTDGADPALWTVIVAPRTPIGTYDVATFGGEEHAYAVGPEFDAALAEQNALRAKAGLAPLPDPGTVHNVAGPTP